MTYTDVVPSRPQGPYALNEVQNPRLLEIAYQAIEEGAKTEEDLKAAIAIDQDKIKLINSGFGVFNLGGKSDFEYQLTPLKFDASTFRNEMRLHILHSIASRARPNDWGLQSVVLLTIEYLLRNEVTRFAQIDTSLRTKIDNWHVEIGYEPQSGNGRMKLNKTKFSLWTNQAEYLGLLYYFKEGNKGNYIVRFDPSLIFDTIQIAVEEHGEGNGIGFGQYLDWLNDTFLRIPLSHEGAVPRPFARALYQLVTDGDLQIVKSGDPAAIGLPGIPAHKNIAPTSNRLKI